jgi:hypothetical protein
MSTTVDYIYYGQEEDRKAYAAFLMTLFHQLRTRRVNHESQWEEGSAIGLPEYTGSFTYGRVIAPGAKKSQFQTNSTIPIANTRFASIVSWLTTPQNLLWSKVSVSNPYLKKQKGVRPYLNEVTRILWAQRYRMEANFVGSNARNMNAYGVLGNMGMFVDELANYLDPKDRGIRYISTPVGEIYLIIDHQGRIVGFVRHFRLNAQQAKYQFPDEELPVVEAALKTSSQTLFDFLHFVRPRTDYNPYARLSKKGKKFSSVYVAVQDFCICEEGPGYRTLPLAYSRFFLAPEEDYGRGPLQLCLASGKTLNAATRVYMKQAHRAGDPAYIVADTGLVSLKTHSGAWNAGLMTRDGKKLIDTLPFGDIQYNEKMMEMEKDEIAKSFLLDLFRQVLDDPKSLSNARQVVEYVNERGIFLFPLLGPINADYLGPLIDRELDILAWQRRLPPMPQVMREAGGEYEMEYTNPLGLAMRGSQIAGYMRTMEAAAAAIKSGADPSIFDVFDLDEALPEMGEWNLAPENWFANPQKLAQRAQARQKAQQDELKVKMMAPQAAIIKAQAIAAKAQAGQNIGGTLSGVPEGQMPTVPGGA